jgi:murein DD-endopeptidase MepM/ murein hydrolase activator NlpD
MKKTSIGFILIITGALSVSAQLLRHEVSQGETLYSIARRYDLTVAQLTSGNDLETPDFLLPGTLLTIPNRYKVERGDTLFSIARRFGTTVEEISSANSLSSSSIRVGQTLTLPQGSVVPPEADSVAEQNPPEPDEADQTDRTPPPTDSPDSTESSDSTEERIVVAAEISRPLDYAQGGIWPVAGDRRILEGKLPGVMIRADRGAPVYSIASGRVVYAGPHTTFGNVVFVQSSQDYIYVYGGQESVTVSVGDIVEAGAPIGSVGLSPSEGYGALYFTVWRNNRFVDPETAPRG